MNKIKRILLCYTPILNISPTLNSNGGAWAMFIRENSVRVYPISRGSRLRLSMTADFSGLRIRPILARDDIGWIAEIG